MTSMRPLLDGWHAPGNSEAETGSRQNEEEVVPVEEFFPYLEYALYHVSK